MLNFLRRIIPDTHPIRLFYHKIVAIVSAVIYGFPSRHLKVICVTGTNGKTTTVNLIARVLEEAGFKVGMMSTINFQVGAKKWVNDTKQTTQGRFLLQKLLREMAKASCQYAVIETSSHAMTQFRLWGVNVDTAVLTNISADHIEYHGSFDKYLHAKGMLFRMLNRLPRKAGVPKISVLNRDELNFSYFDQFFADRKLTYGVGKGTLNATDIQMTPEGSLFTLNVPNDKVQVLLKIPGRFNVYNALAAATVAISENVPLAKIRKALEKAMGVDGRFESIQEGQPEHVIVDYGHTPDALEKLFSLYRELTKGRLFAVFGATGGGRDKGKRPIMGQIADKYADFIVLTDDDPYSEDEWDIIEMVSAGIKRKEGKNFWKVPNRREAIRLALTLSGKDDTVVIAGKGCEPIQMVHGERRPWDDRKVVRELLKREIHVTL